MKYVYEYVNIRTIYNILFHIVYPRFIILYFGNVFIIYVFTLATYLCFAASRNKE